MIGGSAIYGFAYRPESYRTAVKTRYHLFAIKGKHRVPLKWSKDVPFLARAMVLAGETLFLAGPPANAIESKSAYEGAEGVVLCAVSAKNGSGW